VIFYVYEGNLPAFASTFGSRLVWNLQLFINHGYGVCVPELRISPEHPAQSIREMLACAVKSLVAEGVADPGRLGIFGHSFGGYIVNVAITGLDCFTAAVSSTGSVNYTSFYGTPTQSGDASCGSFVESGQAHMGVPPWANPERYIENSPLFTLDRVNTPVLIMHGDRDDYVSQSWEMFNGLRRLKKPAELAIYHGESHSQGDWRRANVIDFWERMIGWFDRYLGRE
jgi:dipeptidyl aminopeptidase/acylaminoacyl peptidase